MRKTVSLFLLGLLGASALAQQETANPSEATKRYREYRVAITEPTYGLAKVKKLCRKIKPDTEMNHRLPQRTYNKLSFEEKFTYTMIHGEDELQNCDAMPLFKDEEKKIFGYVPDAFQNETGWSERQRKFLKDNRSKVIPLIRSTIKTRNRVGANLKSAILEIDATELIPDLAAYYSVKKYDNDVLTVMMLLMREGKFEPFMKSQSYEKLYGEHSSYRGFLEANPENKALVIERAMAYYKSKSKM